MAEADYVLYAESDGFAADLDAAAREAAAAGPDALVPVELAYDAETIRAEVTRLGELFGTAETAADWLNTFDTQYTPMVSELLAFAPTPAPTAVADVRTTDWADLAKIEVVGSYGPQPVTPEQLTDLIGHEPELLLTAAGLPDPPEIPGAVTIELAVFPGEDLDLLGVFRTNVERIGSYFAS